MGISIRVHWVSHSLCSTRTFSKFITSHRQVSRVSFRAPTLHLTTTTAVAGATAQWGSNSGSSDTTTTQSVTRTTHHPQAHAYDSPLSLSLSLSPSPTPAPCAALLRQRSMRFLADRQVQLFAPKKMCNVPRATIFNKCAPQKLVLAVAAASTLMQEL